MEKLSQQPNMFKTCFLMSIFTFSWCDPCCKTEIFRGNQIPNIDQPEKVDCSYCGLLEIPKDFSASTSVLMLRKNQIKTIPSSSFSHLSNLTVLDLFDNPIQELKKDSFLGLFSLQHLDLRRTEFHLQKPLPAEVFHPFANLLTLKLDDIFPGDVKEVPKSIFASLVNLTFLQMAVPEAFVFGDEFQKLKRLKTLVIFGWNCNLGYISHKTFKVFVEIGIEVLEIRDCKVAQVDPSAFGHFAQLTKLNLACNKEGILTNFLDAVRQIPSTNLTTLILDGSNRGDRFQSLDQDVIYGKIFRQITHLSLRLTRIIRVEPEFFIKLPNLEHITFGFDTFLFLPNEDFYNRTAHILSATKLTTVDISHFGELFGGQNNFRNLYCRDADRYSDDFFRKIPSYITLPEHKTKLKEINYTRFDSPEKFLFDNLPSSFNVLFAQSLASRNTKLNGLHLSDDNNVVYMDFSLVPIKLIAKPLLGLNKLQGLDLSFCRIESVVPDAFSYLPSIVYLNLTRNSLKLVNLPELFQNVSSLKYLDLGFNDLEIIPNDTFDGMENLTSLVLKGNPLKQVAFNLFNNNKLEFIDLSWCSLPYLVKDSIDQLGGLQKRVKQIIMLDLSGNMFECECPAIHFIEWLRTTEIEIANKGQLECRYKDMNVSVSSIDLKDLKRRCSGWPSDEALATIAIGVITLAVVVVYLAFEYRWTLRWYYFKFKKYLFQQRKRLMHQENSEQNIEKCTVFVSYDQFDDPDWVENVLVTKLEDEWELETCLVKRDFDAGIGVLEIAFQALDQSNFTIIVVTKTYETSCLPEMRMAIAKGIKNIVVIYKENFEEMTDELRGLLKTAKCLEYSEEQTRLKMLWSELREFLNRK